VRPSASSEGPLADVTAEGSRVLDAATGAGIPLRLIGGVAVRLRAGELPESLQRAYGDIDFVTSKKSTRKVASLFDGLGYTAHITFNALNGKERLLFFDEPNDRQVDVFVGTFRMCHEIPVGERLEVDPTSIPLAELLLTKLQVHELNEKDIRDTIAILSTCVVSDDDGGCVNGARVAQLLAADWGLWRTTTFNLARCREHLTDYAGVDREHVGRQFDELERLIEEAPKSRSWRARARVGERKRWYELPEERG
jgi:hypothetical protein